MQHPGLACACFCSLYLHCLSQMPHDTDCLTTWNKFMMTGVLPNKKRLLTEFPHLSNSGGLFFSSQSNAVPNPLWWLHFWHRSHKSVSSLVMTILRVFISIWTIKQLLMDCDLALFLFACQKTRTNFVATQCMFNFSFKVMWHGLSQIPTSSDTSWTVRHRFAWITKLIFSTWSSSTYMKVCPNLGHLWKIFKILNTVPLMALWMAQTTVLLDPLKH